jgi:Flp pilus assembly protein TadG
MSSIARRRAQGQRGTAIVEMAIVIVLFFFIVFAMLDYGWAFSVRENMIHSAQEGLRTALVTGSADQSCAARAAARQRMAGVIGATRAGTTSPMSSTAPCTDPTADLTVTVATASCVGTVGATCMTVTMSYPYGKDSLVAIPGYPELVPQTINITATERIS